MPRYVFREDAILANINNASLADPEIIGAELEKITDRTPENIVAAATNKRNRLHQHFEWDDAVAGHKHRLTQARSLCLVIKTIDDDEDDGDTQPAFISIKNDDDGRRRYYSNKEVVNSRELQIRVLKQAERDLAAWEARYKHLVDICELVHRAKVKVAQGIAEMTAK